MSIGNAFGSHEGYLKIIGETDDKGLFLFGMFDDPKNFMPPPCDAIITHHLR
jgi:hypothetical protein